MLNLRPYQTECVTAITDALTNHRSTLAVLPTGVGKSVIFSELSSLWPGPVLVLAHRTELVQQAKRHLERANAGEWVDVDQADSRPGSARLVVGSVQTLKGKRLAALSQERFTLIIVDEFHHAVNKSYTNIFNHFSEAKILGVTATPDRLDQKGLAMVCDSVAYRMDISDAMDQGWLVPIMGKRRVLTNIKLDKVKKLGGDFQAAQLDNEVSNGMAAMVPDILELTRGRRTLAFFPGVKTAELAAAMLNDRVPGCAVFVSGTTKPDDRYQAFRDFESGKAQYMCNCQIVTEGVDLPVADCIVIARPTMSRALFTQMLGRGLRPLAGVVDIGNSSEERCMAIALSSKPSCLVIDYVGVSRKHTLVGPIDVLGSAEPPAVIERAKHIARAQEQVDYRAAIELAKKEIAELAKVRVTYSAHEELFSPFSVLGIGDVAVSQLRTGRSAVWFRHAELMKRFGVPPEDIKKMDGAAAKKVMAKLFERRKQNLATYKQLALLKKYMNPAIAEKVRFDQVSGALNAISANRYRWLDDDVAAKLIEG